MEKLIYTLEGASIADPGDFAARLREAGAKRTRLNLRDDDVAPATPLAQARGENPPDAVVQFWLPSSNALFRQEAEAVVAGFCKAHHGSGRR